MKEGRITGMAFLGDFLSRCARKALTEALWGDAFRREGMDGALRWYPLENYFGEIIEEEILGTIFYGHG